MMTPTTAWTSHLLVLASLGFGPAQQSDAVVEIVVDPAAVRLAGPQASYSLLVHGKTADGQLLDLTRGAVFHSVRSEIASVTAGGLIQARGDGKTQVTVEVDGKKGTVTVEVTESS